MSVCSVYFLLVNNSKHLLWCCSRCIVVGASLLTLINEKNVFTSFVQLYMENTTGHGAECNWFLLLISAGEHITTLRSQSGQLQSGAFSVGVHVNVHLSCLYVDLTHSGASYKSSSPFPGLVRTQQELMGVHLFSFLFFSFTNMGGCIGGQRVRREEKKRREINEGGGLMRALTHMIMGLADRNQDLSQRSQLTPSPYSNYAWIAPLALY